MSERQRGSEDDEAPAWEARARRGRPGYDHATVLRRAIDLFNRQGYDGTSMGDLAKELGFTKSAIYHHVPSKSHLLEEALHEALDELTAAVASATGASATGASATGASDGPSAYQRLRHVVQRSVEVLVAHQPAVTLLLRLRGNTEVERTALQRRREFDRIVTGLVRAAEHEGDVRADVDPAVISRLLFGTVNSLTEWYRQDGDLSAADLADAVVTVTFSGLRT